MKFEGNQFFVKSHDEMYRVFKDSPDVLTRTLDIAERCNLRLEKVAIRSRSSMSRPATPSTATSSTSRAKALRGAWRRCARCTSKAS